MIYIIIILLAVGFYCLFAFLFKTPAIKKQFVYKKTVQSKKRSGKTEILAYKLSLILPMSSIKHMELERELKSAGIEKSPKQYKAEAFVESGIWVILCTVLFVVLKALSFNTVAIAIICFSILLIAFYKYSQSKKRVYRQITKRAVEIEKELQGFASYLAIRLKTDRNIINAFDSYRANYDNALSRELALTVGDMRTGNQEQALLNFSQRINSPLLNELSRGVLASINGDNVEAFFDGFSKKLSVIWCNRLEKEALKKPPRINRISFLVFVPVFASTFVVLIMLLLNALKMFGGF